VQHRVRLVKAGPPFVSLLAGSKALLGAALGVGLALGLSACGGGENGGTGGATASGGNSGVGGLSAVGGGVGVGGSSSDGGASPSSGGANTELPADNTQAGIEAFLATESYKTWRHDPAPRAPGEGNPHLTNVGQLQVYMNSTAVLSIQAAEGQPALQYSHVTGSMVVKEVYDTGGTRVAVAASIKSGDARRAFTFYCEGTIEGCGVNDEPPIYGTDGSACSNCHGGSIFAPLPPE